MNARVTMANVATRAGLHVTTVSLALRNSPRLPLATRQKVQTLARQLGYCPDPDLAALVAYRKAGRQTKHTETLAYVTHSGSRWGWRKSLAHTEFFDGASARAAALGRQVAHFWLGEPGLTPRRLSDILFSRNIRGMIFASYWACESQLRDFAWPHFSSIAIDIPPPQMPALHTVTNDQRMMTQIATRHVRAAGYRRIGLVLPRWWAAIGDFAWPAGFLAEQEKFPAEDRLPILFYGTPRVGTSPLETVVVPVSREEFEPWFEEFRPDALISYGPFLQPRLAAMGLHVPRDVAFADLFLREYDGKTAGIRQNCRRVGELAVEVLASQLQQNTFGLPSFPTTTLIGGTWIDGASLPRPDAPRAAG